MNVFSKVRESTRKVTKQARSVKWYPGKLEKLADTFDPQEIIDFYRYDGDFYFKGENESLLNYVITLNAMNFGSGLSVEWKKKRRYKDSSFKSVAFALKSAIENNISLDVNFAKQITGDKLAQMIGVNPEFKLIKMFRKSLNELGEFVFSKFGTYSEMINSLSKKTRANNLVSLLTNNLSCYKDIAKYDDFDVYFLKRAQILVNDLYLAFKGKGYGEMGDIAGLTMFADNLLPHFFRVNGVLEYDTDLAEKIRRGILIENGSPQEVEIRAFAVQCVEKLQEILSKKEPSIKSAQIDCYIWEQSQAPKYKSIPRHRTVTLFY